MSKELSSRLAVLAKGKARATDTNKISYNKASYRVVKINNNLWLSEPDYSSQWHYIEQPKRKTRQVKTRQELEQETIKTKNKATRELQTDTTKVFKRPKTSNLYANFSYQLKAKTISLSLAE